jgi:hypothetical protein
MSDTPDNNRYEKIDPSTLDWKKDSQLYATLPGKRDTGGRGSDDTDSVLVSVIFPNRKVHWPIYYGNGTHFMDIWLPESGAIVKYPDGSIEGYSAERFAREHEVCELIDPETLDWGAALPYQACHFPNNDLSRTPSLGQTVSVIFTDNSVCWPTRWGQEGVPKFGAILKTDYGQIRGLDRQSFQSQYMPPEMLAQMGLKGLRGM